MADELHQPFRMPMLAGSRELIELAYDRGAAGACLSGAGPTVLAICDSPTNAHARREGLECVRPPRHGHATALRHEPGPSSSPTEERVGGYHAHRPMSLVTISGVSKGHAAQHLFADVGLMISAGRRMAIVGPNGAGKTTLLELITGDQEPDAGTITRAREVVIGYLRQEVAESRGRSVLAEVLAGAGEVSGIERRMRHIESELEDAEDEEELAELMDEYGRLQHRFEALGGYGLEAEARRILAGLGFADADMERDMGEF